MCRPATCRTCGKASWAGCGQHVDQVLGNVPQSQRCSCDSQAAHSPANDGASFFSRLFGR